MAGSANEKSKLGYRIFLGAVVLALGGSMLLYLVPQGPATDSSGVSSDTVAKIGDETVTTKDIQQQLSQIERTNQVPQQLKGFYAQQILQQLVFQREIEYEAKRLGIAVSDQERADRIKMYLPMAFNGGTFIGMDQYTALVQQRLLVTVVNRERGVLEYRRHCQTSILAMTSAVVSTDSA